MAAISATGLLNDRADPAARAIRSRDVAPIGACLLIRRAELLGGEVADVRIVAGRVAAIGTLASLPGERQIDAAGGLLMPGLHDHHLHVAASAAALSSVHCGPPDVGCAQDLHAALGVSGSGWVRGTGYHESVAGMIDRDWLDAAAPGRPVRVQHRSGRMWVFNSAALERLLSSGVPPPPGLQRENGRWTGRLFDDDRWVRQALGSTPPAFDGVGAQLAAFGVTGITEMSPANDDATARHFAAEQARCALPQRVLLGGSLGLSARECGASLRLGAVKLHLHEEHLPAFDEAVAMIAAAHERGRAVAVHCVTAVELGFTLAALREAGCMTGDRIEHASVTPEAALAEIAAMPLAVVAQPNFVAERGDAYRAMIPRDEWPELYRLRSFHEAGVPLAGGTDAPFGRPDPWAAMAAAVSRRTAGDEPLGTREALSPEEALALFLADPGDVRRVRRIEVGADADLCLLAVPWANMRERLSADLVRSTLIGGRIVHDRVDEPPR